MCVIYRQENSTLCGTSVPLPDSSNFLFRLSLSSPPMVAGGVPFGRRGLEELPGPPSPPAPPLNHPFNSAAAVLLAAKELTWRMWYASWRAFWTGEGVEPIGWGRREWLMTPNVSQHMNTDGPPLTEGANWPFGTQAGAPPCTGRKSASNPHTHILTQ